MDSLTQSQEQQTYGECDISSGRHYSTRLPQQAALCSSQLEQLIQTDRGTFYRKASQIQSFMCAAYIDRCRGGLVLHGQSDPVTGAGDLW